LIQLYAINNWQVKGGDSFLKSTGTSAEHEAREKLASLKNLYRAFFDNAFEMVFRTSPEDRIVFSNKPFNISFGFESQHHAKGKAVSPIFEDAQTYIDLKTQVLQIEKLAHKKVFFKRPDGQRMTGLVNCQLYTDERGVPTLNWTVLDISDRVEYEERLQHQNQQLAKVNQQMEKFLYSTSHDLRSPLTSILGLVNLMRLETKDKTIQDYVDKVETSATKLDKIIRDIVSFSRATYQRTRSERIDFEPFIWKVLNNYRDEPSMRKINIQVHASGDSQYYNDPERVEIIIDNLIRNAIHFFDSNKSRPFLRIRVALTDKLAQFEFADNGIGIGQHHLENIFTMFYKASHLSKGAGLGLYIVKETLSQLQGTITVESEIGFGSVFRVSIPNDHKGKLINRKLHLHQSL
jgi:PAS domain S-box-containing protein